MYPSIRVRTAPPVSVRAGLGLVLVLPKLINSYPVQALHNVHRYTDIASRILHDVSLKMSLSC